VKVIRGIPPSFHRTPCALTIGNFDGVHQGHLALLKKLQIQAKQLQVQTCVLTFEPHPKEFFDPANAPARILNLRDKLEALQAADIDLVVVERFNANFASMSPEVFVQKIIVDGLHAKHIVIGDDFCYGAKRAGSFTTLQQAGKMNGFTVESMDTVLDQQQTRISSSAIRQALKDGQIAGAKQLLGRPYTISGHVIHGKKLGRTIGFPTLNLAISSKARPRVPAIRGIFIVQVHGLSPSPLPAVASIGVRPTVEDAGRVLLETHIFDFNQAVYGKVIRVEFIEKLRDEAKYPDLASLQQAIHQDAQKAINYFKNASNV
jgi:riboflavin kinase/FMN adenylyltransferase